MAKATIKSKSGAIITVEGTNDEISNILTMFERSSVVGQAKEAIARIKSAHRGQKKRAGASDLIVELREDGFLDKPKTLAEISKALEENGHLYPTTTLSGIMLGLVQKKLIGRKQIGGKWVYGK
jgi:hypothetical protein